MKFYSLIIFLKFSKSNLFSDPIKVLKYSFIPFSSTWMLCVLKAFKTDSEVIKLDLFVSLKYLKADHSFSSLKKFCY